MLPQEFEKRMKDMLGEDYEEFLKGFEKPRFYGLRRNPLKIEEKEFLEKLPYLKRKIPWCDTGYYYENDKQPGKHPFHEAGLYYIQEPSAMSAAEYLPVKEGERVLDLCAAPGGKTTQLAGKMGQRGLLVSNEIHPARAKILSENVERMGIKNTIVTNETPVKLAKHFPEYFDKILVDAPCSGEGMFRKNEEALSEWSKDNVILCANRQDEILQDVVKMLRPGGLLCYSTCTFAPAENEECVERFLDQYEEFSLLPTEKKEGMEEGNPDWTKKKKEEICKTIRLWPHRLDGEGHFIALYQKKGVTEIRTEEEDSEEDRREEAVIPKKGREEYRPGKKRKAEEKGNVKDRLLKIKEVKPLEEFLKENLRIELPDRILLFGDQVYLLPEEAPSLTGLKVLRPGLHLGTLKKNRFEPSHALALSLKPEEVCFSYDMESEGKEIREYLLGQTLSHEGEKGWYLMTTEGYSIGWGKLAGGIIKNHYPKGLRR